MKYVIYALFLCIPVFADAQKNEFAWLVGTWQEENKSAFEEWTVTDGFLSATSYKMDASGNRQVTEVIKLIKKGKDFFYVPDVAGPQGEVEFKITTLESDGFVAENPAHDFPKKIAYKKLDDQRLVATISGGTKAIRYAFRKIK